MMYDSTLFVTVVILVYFCVVTKKKFDKLMKLATKFCDVSHYIVVSQLMYTTWFLATGQDSS
jgi:hypothetical protein